MTDAAAVELDGVRVVYGETTALADVSVQVEPGEFFTLVGPSGCGKTTTLRVLGGFESPTAGSVQIGGRDVSGVPPEGRGVGVVFQHYALFPHMTVAENVGYGLRFTDPPGGVTTDERVAELLSLVGLPEAGERDPTTLSGGQQQRVALARALAPGPRLLLLDEPLSALDAQLRERLRRRVRQIQRELGITTVYVTHDQAEALAVSDRLAVVSDGRIEQVGTPREVYRRPATRFVAEFVGDNNVFEGTVTAVGEHAGDDGVGSDDRLPPAVGAETAAEGDDERLATVTVGERELTVAADCRRGASVTFCVRPGALDPDVDQNRLDVTVTETEFLGETSRVRGEWRGRSITLRTTNPPPVGETVTVGFDPRQIHVVDITD